MYNSIANFYNFVLAIFSVLPQPLVALVNLCFWLWALVSLFRILWSLS